MQCKFLAPNQINKALVSISTQEDEEASSHLFSALHMAIIGHFNPEEWEMLHKQKFTALLQYFLPQNSVNHLQTG